MAVLLLDSCCARAARMTAIHVRIVAVYGDMIRMRCVARPRDTAVDIRAADNRRRYTRELVAFVGNFSDFAIIVLADIDVRLRPIRRLGLRRARVAREVDAAVVLQQGQRFHRRSRRRELRPVHLGRGAARQVQHRAMRGNAVHIEGDLLEADNVRGGIRARNIQRVARAVCLCAACDRTRDIRAVDIDRVFVCSRAAAARDTPRDVRLCEADDIFIRRRTIAADDIAGDCAIADRDAVARGFAACGLAARDGAAVCLDIDNIARRIARRLTADNAARDCLVNRDLVARRLAAAHITVAAVDCARNGGRAVHRDLVGNAVAARVCRSLRACARRPAAVDVRVIAGGNGDAVLRRRIARRGATAPCVPARGRALRRTLESVGGVADDVGQQRAGLPHIEIRLARAVGVQHGLRLVVIVGDGQTCRVVYECRRRFRHRAVRFDSGKIHSGCAPCERQHRICSH